MKSLALIRRHAALVTALVAIELGLAWFVAHRLVAGLLAAVGPHPDGVRALFADGARGFFDLVSHASSAPIARSIVLAIACVSLWTVIAVALDTLAASAFTRGRASLRQLGATLVVEFAALLGYVALGIVGWLSGRAAQHATHTFADPRVADLSVLVVLIPTLAAALVLHVARDVALVQACDHGDSLAALQQSLSMIRRSPSATVGRRLVVLGASSAVLAAGAALNWDLARPISAGVVAFIALQQALAVLRILLRYQWVAHVASLVRAGSSEQLTPSASP